MNPRNDSGFEIPGWHSQDCHNTPALILADGFEFLHLRYRGWRRLLLRLLSTEQASSFRLGGSRALFGQPEIGRRGMEMNPSGKRKYSGSDILKSLRSGERIVYATGNCGSS